MRLYEPLTWHTHLLGLFANPAAALTAGVVVYRALISRQSPVSTRDRLTTSNDNYYIFNALAAIVMLSVDVDSTLLVVIFDTATRRRPSPVVRGAVVAGCLMHVDEDVAGHRRRHGARDYGGGCARHPPPWAGCRRTTCRAFDLLPEIGIIKSFGGLARKGSRSSSPAPAFQRLCRTPGAPPVYRGSNATAAIGLPNSRTHGRQAVTFQCTMRLLGRSPSACDICLRRKFRLWRV